ncbi:MAG: hypothetical protein ACR2IV_13725 [Bryobacteraceae bacterium]
MMVYRPSVEHKSGLGKSVNGPSTQSEKDLPGITRRQRVRALLGEKD